MLIVVLKFCRRQLKLYHWVFKMDRKWLGVDSMLLGVEMIPDSMIEECKVY